MNGKSFCFLAVSLLFAGCGPVLNLDSLVWIDPVDSGADGSVSDAGPDSGTDAGSVDAGPADGGGWDGGSPCLPTNPCVSPKGICTPNGAAYTCTCNAGYHDVSGNCVLDQACQSNSCGGHGACTAPGGVVTCSCDVGYEPLYCGTCSTNWQDNDSNGSCLKACTHPTLGLNCNGHGTCSDTSGTATCACNPNWNPAVNCASCLAGFQDNDSNGTCLAVCAAGTCNGHGTCLDTSGTATCTCNANWNPANSCNSCLAGFQDNDSNGTCLAVCAAGTCNGHGTCLDTSGTATCTCSGNWDPATSCLSCKAGFGGANCDPMATVSVSQLSGALTTLSNVQFLALKFRLSCTGGACSVVRLTFSTQFTGSGQIIGQDMYKDGSLVTTATFTRTAGRVVAVFSPENQVGASSDYMLYLTPSGTVSGDTLTVALLSDAAATPTMVGSTGFIHNTVGSYLYTSASGLCGSGTPNFVWSGLAHTAPSPTCNITSFGTADYSTGFEVGAWSVTNTMTAP